MRPTPPAPYHHGMRGFRGTWPFLVAIVLVYLAPAAFGWVLSVTAAGQPVEARESAALAVWALFALMVNPIACMATSFFVGWRRGFVWLFPIVVALAFVPVGWAILGARGLVYPVIYLVFGLIGWWFGWSVHRRQQSPA